MPRKPNPTAVFSFRLPIDKAEIVMRYIKKAKTTRAEFAEKMFLESFNKIAEKEASA